MDARSNELQFWREAPRIGLTGVAWIEIGRLGVSAENVAYDLNMVSDLLWRLLGVNERLLRIVELT
jgi:hypothetical protein